MNVTHGRPLYSVACYDNFTFFDVVPCSYHDRLRSASLILLGETSDDDGDSSAVYEMKKNHGQAIFERYNNILSLRQDKMLNFFTEVRSFSSIQDYIPVKYEDLVETGTASLIKDIEQKMNLQSRCIPKNLANAAISNTKIYSKEYIKLINDNVDWPVEALVGYEPLALNSSGKDILIVDGSKPLHNTSSIILYDEGMITPLLDEPILDPQDTYDVKVKETNYTLNNILESIHLNWHPETREQRFPSVDERVKVYMSNWYAPCHNSSGLGFKVDSYNGSYPLMNLNPEAGTPFRFDSMVTLDKPLILDRETLDVCVTENTSLPLYTLRVHGYIRSYRDYCQDSLGIINFFQGLEDPNITSKGTNGSSVPLIVQFGDAYAHSRTVPIISKYRMRALNKESLNRVLTRDLSCKDPYLNVIHRAVSVDWSWDSYYWDAKPFYQPIVWNLNRERHFGYELRNARYEDIPWDSKKLGALWRGAMNGGPEPTQITPEMSSLQICQMNTRCRFVYQHENSSLVYARLTSSILLKKEDVPKWFSDKVTVKDILQYKVVISLEGNDVSSGLKWNLLCNSVVMMPPPTETSWLMEELLEPWVHYIPLKPDGSNAEEMIKWVGENDLKARRIAERGTLFMYDLLYHPDAEKDDVLVRKEILRRYKLFWS